MKSAIVTGVTGQDGAYVSQLLLNKGYVVNGTYRSSGAQDFWRITELGIRDHANLRLIEFEAHDLRACQDLIARTGACEIYNLGGQSSAVTSLSDPVGTAKANGMVPMYWLEAIRSTSPSTRFFQAGSSELFGQATQIPQVETTALCPTSPYGVSKLFAHWSTVNYRERFGIFATSGILFNHESPLRGPEFVTRKITSSLAKISLGTQDTLDLGNMDSRRDWGYAKDYALGMWNALQADEADTFVFATNRLHSVRDFVTLAGKAAGFDLHWKGEAENEIGIDRNSGKNIVRVNPKFYRPMDIHQRVGDAAKAFRKLGWKPDTTLDQLCGMMIEADILRHRGEIN